MNGQKRITLMHVINAYILAGAEKLVYDLVAGLDKKKFEISVCSIGVVRDKIGQEICDDLKGKGIKTLVVGKPPGRQRFATVRKLRRYLLENHVAILHTHCPSPDFYGKIGAFLARTPLVFTTIHSINGYHAFHESILEKLTTGYIAVSETVNRYAVCNLMIPSAKIEVVRNAVDSRKFCRIPLEKNVKLKELGVPAGKKIVATVGVLRELKGHRYLIEAAEQVLRKFPETHFLIIGDTSADPDYTNRIRGMVNARNLQHSISLTGKRVDMPEILSLADIFVLPSLWEGLSLALLEAMAVGIPVIATNVGGTPEVVTNGMNGFIVPSENAQLLAQKIEELLADPQKANSLSARGKEMIKESFGLGQLVEKHEELYLRHLKMINK